MSGTVSCHTHASTAVHLMMSGPQACFQALMRCFQAHTNTCMPCLMSGTHECLIAIRVVPNCCMPYKSATRMRVVSDHSMPFEKWMASVIHLLCLSGCRHACGYDNILTQVTSCVTLKRWLVSRVQALVSTATDTAE